MPLRFLAMFLVLNCAPPASAGQTALTESDIDALDLRAIDASLSEISLQINQLRSESGLDSNEGPFSAGAENSIGAVSPNTARAPANALCFGDATLGLTTPTALNSYLEDLDALVHDVDTTLAAFAGLKEIHPKGECPVFMSEMIVTLERRLGAFSRRDISDLAFHLETCWPDRDIVSENSEPLEMDTQYARARSGLREYGRSARGFREASNWCE